MKAEVSKKPVWNRETRQRAPGSPFRHMMHETRDKKPRAMTGVELPDRGFTYYLQPTKGWRRRKHAPRHNTLLIGLMARAR